MMIIPPIDKELLVSRHPNMVLFFSHEEQITILSRLWCDRVFTEEQCIALNSSMKQAIEDIRDTWRELFDGIYL